MLPRSWVGWPCPIANVSYNNTLGWEGTGREGTPHIMGRRQAKVIFVVSVARREEEEIGRNRHTHEQEGGGIFCVFIFVY